MKCCYYAYTFLWHTNTSEVLHTLNYFSYADCRKCVIIPPVLVLGQDDPVGGSSTTATSAPGQQSNPIGGISSSGTIRGGTLDVLLSTTYCRNQMYLSRQLAQLHPELTMPMFSGKFSPVKLEIFHLFVIFNLSL